MKKTVLIIDDDPEFIDATTAILEAAGYAVIAATDGQRGFERAQADKPHLLLLDVMMTYDSEGMELARRFRDDPLTRKVPVIIVTGIQKAKSLPFAMEPDENWLPVKRILEKPVDPQLLLSTIAEALP